MINVWSAHRDGQSSQHTLRTSSDVRPNQIETQPQAVQCAPAPDVPGRQVHQRSTSANDTATTGNNNINSNGSGANEATGSGNATAATAGSSLHPPPPPSKHRLVLRDKHTPHALSNASSPSVTLSPSSAVPSNTSTPPSPLAAGTNSSTTAVQSSASSRSVSIPAQLLPPRTHSRAESVLTNRELTASPVPSITNTLMASPPSSSSPLPSKGHTSPSKASSTRTYDSKLVSREMHRLGTLAHLPGSLAPPLGTASSSTLPIPQTTANTSPADKPWSALHVHVLPLFNGEPLRIPIEDLNALVKRHIQTVVSLAPSKAILALENDVADLIASGMITLSAKLVDIDNSKLVVRVVEIWGFFWDQVLPYVEGVLLPLQTDPILSSLYRTPKQHRSSSPSTRSKSPLSTAPSALAVLTPKIDVRTTALRAFRDRIVLPLFQRLHACLTATVSRHEGGEWQQPRLQQMLLVLTSQPSKTRPPAFSLTAPSPQLTQGEKAAADLLRVMRAPHRPSSHVPPIPVTPGSGQKSRGSMVLLARPPSFLNGAPPRDRRGRVRPRRSFWEEGDGWARATEFDLSDADGDGDDGGEEADGEGDETPRYDGTLSPGARASVGGWGLGGGIELLSLQQEEDEDEPLGWDEAQAVVERMVGMTPGSGDPPPVPEKGPGDERKEGRRRLT